MNKRAAKKKALRIDAPQEVRSAIRAFVLAHRRDIEKQDLEDLRIYLDAYHKYRTSTKELETLVDKERTSIAVEMKARHMEEDLFSPPAGDRPVKLGSCFCPKCSRFKNYKKECPHCGHHEMTV
ncbi:MAG: hypothetical protein ACMUHB_04305 [Thermoplasmatota archaeon]